MTARGRRDGRTPSQASAWSVLLASAVLEAIWALALHASHGFTVLVPSLVFAVAAPLSMIGLGYAMRGIPLSTAYAVWTGTGAALTVLASMVLGTEPVSVLKLLFIAGIVGCVVGLKFAPASAPAPARKAVDAESGPAEA